MSEFQKTKHGMAICPFFTWQSDDNTNECDIVLTFCIHPDNKDNCEGNCSKERCPLIK